ncbi:hypothetical protein COU58_02980 [Candidatus Pacearchaeota archaeon CG10_big_fil_rev_8_21_14_0_10_32_42]|nr:MAG: hypothetical protein COU58_02980 [Candidatus Pacearchaeota archaeon CG10_big_fil_rev_8_21_14_0_10_32_42]
MGNEEEPEDNQESAKVVTGYLNSIIKEILCLKKKIDGRDIRDKFSKTQSEMYERFLEYFIFISGDSSVQKEDYAEKEYWRNRNPCEIQKSIHFFHKGRQRGKQLPSPVYTLSPYSNFGDGFKFQRTK